VDNAWIRDSKGELDFRILLINISRLGRKVGSGFFVKPLLLDLS
jgi:hypothetical protein